MCNVLACVTDDFLTMREVVEGKEEFADVLGRWPRYVSACYYGARSWKS
jgi:hypothetical protein